MNNPNYNKIYSDLIEKEFPERRKELNPLLSKEIKTSLEFIEIHRSIFTHQTKEMHAFNQKLHSYDQISIQKIIEYQRVNKINNIQTSKLFGISRNTLAKWKSQFPLSL
ncbi:MULTISPECIES: helix-turn-helix domain-containing protein [Chryseobacterium]|uniref:helix-turn-helix domain-containing protein n=1 Tax=Chryseobacterium TaxID=59732 RepID=UPI001BE64FFD|nr:MULTISPECIES: helix-turn-helix domain-containing protein [Chryseobacterium]MBT2620771.1 helix-turn-helix domain-containing protein [Chryseobacterium sp. ISL-6]